MKAPHADLPRAKPERITGKGDLQPQRFSFRRVNGRQRHLARIVERIKRLLIAVPVDGLAEIALLVEESDRNHGHAQVARGLELVSRDISQAAGVNGQRLAQHVLHAEISGATQVRRVRMFLEPRLSFQVLLPQGEERIEFAGEG